MSGPQVSIVVTNYNYGRFLARAVDSALAQSYPRTEVVVVDDASSDDSASVIRGYGGRIVPVLRETNGGQGAAFNAGFAACRGDVVFFLDADDWLYPSAVARVVEAFGDGVAQVQFRLNMVDAEGRLIDLLPPPEVRFDAGDVVPLLLDRGRYENTVTSGNAFARAALASVLPVPEAEFRISADGYVVTVAPLAGRVAAIDEPLGSYALHGGNNWNATNLQGLGEKFRRAVRHDALRYAALDRQAAARGLVLRAEPGRRDPQHLTSRIGSLAFDPAAHPHPGDSRLGLALDGAWACRSVRLPPLRRALLAAWFVALGIVPRAWAARLVAWRVEPSSRPQRLRGLMGRVRRMLR